MRDALKLSSACIKSLSAVEAVPDRSNQHELNGVAQLRDILGNDKKSFVVNFSIRGKDGYTQSNVTWYDARKEHPTRTEYRLYFRTNGVMSQAKEGSTLIFGLDSKNNFWAELII